jgi:hypothetical protein
MNKEKTLKRAVIFLLSALIILSSTYAFIINSTNYKFNPIVISSGGTNITSSNYMNIIVTGIISENVSSTNYMTSLGFLYASATADTEAPTWNNNQTNLTSDNRINYDVWFYVNWSDNKGLNSYIFSWNGTNGTWQNDTAVTITGLTNVSNVTKTINLSQGNTIGWKFYASDSSGNWNETDTWTFIVNNTPPTTPVLISPENENTTTNRTPYFNWTSTDADGDTIYYDIFIYCKPACSVDNRIAYNITTSNYTPSTELQYFIDDNNYYIWWVRAFDNISYSSNSSTYNFSIISLVSINLSNSIVDFGDMNNGDSDNTTDDSPLPIIITNNGNSFINLNISAEDLWESQSNPSEYYQFKADNSSELNSFNYSDSITTWTNMSTTDIGFIYWLNHSDNSDSAELDLLVKVPDDEPPGKRNSTITITGYYVKIT